MLSSPRKPVSTMRIFSSAENCRRVARRNLLHNLLCRFFHRPGFLSHLRSFNGYDGPEILPSSTHPFCLSGADAGQSGLDTKTSGDSASFALRPMLLISISVVWLVFVFVYFRTVYFVRFG